MLLDVLGLVIALVPRTIGDGGVHLVEGHKEELLLGLLHRTEQHSVGDTLVAVDGDFGDADALGFLYIEENALGILDFLIGDFLHIHRTAVEALVHIVVADDVGAGGLHIVVDDVALRDVEFLAQVVLLGFCSALETEGEKSGTVLEPHIKESDIAEHASDGDLHVIVEAAFPEGFDALGDFVTRNENLLAHVERKQALVERGGAGGGNAADFILDRIGIINLDRTVFAFGAHNNLTITCSYANHYK